MFRAEAIGISLRQEAKLRSHYSGGAIGGRLNLGGGSEKGPFIDCMPMVLVSSVVDNTGRAGNQFTFGLQAGPGVALPLSHRIGTELAIRYVWSEDFRDPDLLDAVAREYPGLDNVHAFGAIQIRLGG